MSTLGVALLSILILLAAYRWYGGYLANVIFQLDNHRSVPSRQQQDDVDFVPTKCSIVFGHHFTSIAGTGPIVGPALAVFWGWLPALLWVLIGGIFIGAVHDFGALVVSLRNQGETIGQTAGRLINRRTRLLFLLVLFFALSIVLGIFGLVIAQVFQIYPSSVLGTWISLPLAIALGWIMRRFGLPLSVLTAISLVIIYAAVYVGAYYAPVTLDPQAWLAALGFEGQWTWFNPIVLWTFILLTYCSFASILPVGVLLQPRDYLNSWQLILALVVLVAALVFAAIQGKAELVESAPAWVGDRLPQGAPPVFPFLFITIACGAISGFHCLVSSGTTSKQISQESDALTVGYGGMLLESGLAVMVILACCAGIGMGKFQRIEEVAASGKVTISFRAKPAADSPNGVANPTATPSQHSVADPMLDPSVDPSATPIPANTEAFANWRQRYDANRPWTDYRLAESVGAFVDGGASFLTVFAIPLVLGQAILAVLVACFAATTLDSATRLQRYVIQELGSNLKIAPLQKPVVATLTAVGIGAIIAMIPGSAGPGTGGTILWPLFGAINQLLAGLAFLVIGFYLWRRKLPVFFIAIPLLLMLVVPMWALLSQIFGPQGFLVAAQPNYLLGGIGLATLALQVWMIIEAAMLLPKVHGVREKTRLTSASANVPN